jgi:hypothetical protein
MEEIRESKPTIASLDRKGLPPALAMMVNYTETAPLEAVMEEVRRQWPWNSDGSTEVEARSKLAGLILGAALGVTVVPHPEGVTFPALRQAMKLDRMVGEVQERKRKEKKTQAKRLETHRKARKARRRAAKKTR